MRRTAASGKIREARIEDAPGVARVHVDSWRATYRGIVPDSFLDRMSYEESERRWRERLSASSDSGGVFYVAESVGGEVSEVPEISGFASGGPRRGQDPPDYEIELYTLYLSEEYRGSGLGRRLFRSVASGLSESRVFISSTSSMVAWVMAENRPARRFYESLGGVVVGRDVFEVEGESIEEVAYGWRDLTRDLAKLVRSEDAV